MLPPASEPVPATWRELLEELAPVFARRSTHRLFAALARGDDPGRPVHGDGDGRHGGDGGSVEADVLVFGHAVWDLDALGLAVGPSAESQVRDAIEAAMLTVDPPPQSADLAHPLLARG